MDEIEHEREGDDGPTEELERNSLHRRPVTLPERADRAEEQPRPGPCRREGQKVEELHKVCSRRVLDSVALCPNEQSRREKS
jgi:hypothetical protein